MKQAKKVLMPLALIIGICIPQNVLAQQKEKRKITSDDIALLKELDAPKDYVSAFSDALDMGTELDVEVFNSNIAVLKQIQENWQRKPINLVGKWFYEGNSKDNYIVFHADSTGIKKLTDGELYNVKGEDIRYPIKERIYHFTWKRNGNRIYQTSINAKQQIILGDISFYPADIQKRIKVEMDSVKKVCDSLTNSTDYYHIKTFSPETMTLTQGENEWVLKRDISVMNAQERNVFNKEVENWNKIKKEEEQKAYLAALERDNLEMAKLKVKAIASGNQYDYWIIGHMYEYGEGNDGMKTTICLDSALVWYKKAATIDPKNERYVTAVSHKIKTGRDYYEDEAKSEIEGKKKQIAQARATYTKKYGATNSNYLSKQGIVAKGMSIAFIREYINDFNQIGIPSMGTNVHLTLKEYKPTERDMMQYGRTVKSYKLFSNGLAWGDGAIWSFLVLNGKVVSSSKLSVGYEGISMERDWNDK